MKFEKKRYFLAKKKKKEKIRKKIITISKISKDLRFYKVLNLNFMNLKIRFQLSLFSTYNESHIILRSKCKYFQQVLTSVQADAHSRSFKGCQDPTTAIYSHSSN